MHLDVITENFFLINLQKYWHYFGQNDARKFYKIGSKIESQKDILKLIWSNIFVV